MTFQDAVTFSNKTPLEHVCLPTFPGKAHLVSGIAVSGPLLLQRVDGAVSRVGDQMNYSMPR